MQSFVVITLIALVANPTVLARARHRAPKAAAATSATTMRSTPADAKPQNTPEKDRDPADVALDRKIKGICRGC
jgi:hypothetical protein